MVLYIILGSISHISNKKKRKVGAVKSKLPLILKTAWIVYTFFILPITGS